MWSEYQAVEMQNNGGDFSSRFMAKGKKRANSPYFVKFLGEFRSREEFFAVTNLLAKIPVTRCKTIFPFEAVRKAEHDNLVLKGDGLTIEIKHGVTPLVLNSKVSSFGFGSGSLDNDWQITFDQFPHLQVKLTRRGRPRKDLLGARARGEHQTKSWSKLARNWR